MAIHPDKIHPTQEAACHTALSTPTPANASLTLLWWRVDGGVEDVQETMDIHQKSVAFLLIFPGVGIKIWGHIERPSGSISEGICSSSGRRVPFENGTWNSHMRRLVSQGWVISHCPIHVVSKGYTICL